MKYVVIIGDGMADLPLENLDGRTPLIVAKKPYMDMMARKGFCGKLITVPEGFPPGSDIACMSLFGYDPGKYYTGRGPIEAEGLGVKLDNGDVAFRCNLVKLSYKMNELIMEDYSAGHISKEDAHSLIEMLNREIGNEDFKFFTGVSYRNIFIWKKGIWTMKTTPPHDIMGKPVGEYLPQGEGQETVRKIMEEAGKILKKAGKTANGIWLWGQGVKTKFPSFVDLFGLRGGVVCAVDLIKGIARLAGMEAPDIPGATGSIDTNYKAKATKTLELLQEQDAVYVHIEAPDEASHMGDVDEKIKAIEAIDKEIVGYIFEKASFPLRFLITTDHATPIVMRTHMAMAVPFAIFDMENGQEGKVSAFNEMIEGQVYKTEEVLKFFFRKGH